MKDKLAEPFTVNFILCVKYTSNFNYKLKQ
jgi:hypothetical protein